MISEYLTSMPDFGLAQQGNTKNARTATEISQIGSLMGHEIAEVIKLRQADATDDKIIEILQQDRR